MPLSKSDLIHVLAQGSKVPDARGIGIEQECFLYEGESHKRLPYDSIQKILEDFVSDGWQGVFEKKNLIGAQKKGASLSLEPGGQFELSGAIHKTLHDAREEIDEYHASLDRILKKYHFKNLSLGFEPFWQQEDLSWMPKERYKIMREYMPKVGRHGYDMMRRTTTLQINLDYTSEKNMVQMMRLTHLLHPLMAALFAASPFYEGQLSEYQSFRNYVWQDTDKGRCGLLDFVFEESFGFERYVDYLLDVPMYFVYRDGYRDASGLSFRDFMAGKLPGFEGQTPTLSDFSDHMSVAFPEVRLKTFIEIRGIDASPIAFASAAFWVGLLYHQPSLEKAYALAEPLKKRLHEDYVTLPRVGVQEEGQWELAEKLFLCAQEGLQGRGFGEEKHLAPLQKILESRATYAHNLIKRLEKEPNLHKILL